MFRCKKKKYVSINHLPRISSVGQSPKPHGISVVPTMRPNMKPNTTLISMPTKNAMKPDFYFERQKKNFIIVL